MAGDASTPTVSAAPEPPVQHGRQPSVATPEVDDARGPDGRQEADQIPERLLPLCREPVVLVGIPPVGRRHGVPSSARMRGRCLPRGRRRRGRDPPRSVAPNRRASSPRVPNPSSYQSGIAAGGVRSVNGGQRGRSTGWRPTRTRLTRFGRPPGTMATSGARATPSSTTDRPPRSCSRARAVTMDQPTVRCPEGSMVSSTPAAARGRAGARSWPSRG